MAEPFGIGAGVVGVISLTIQITQIAVKFGLDWKDAPATIKAVMAELAILKTVLSETNTNILLNADFAEAFQQRPSVLLSQLGPDASSNTDTRVILEICERNLKRLLENLRKKNQGHRLGWERFKGAFQAKEIQDSVQNLSRQCKLLNSMLSIDTAVLGVTTYKEVKEGRREQQEWHRADAKITLDIRDGVNKSNKHGENQAQEHILQSILHWLTPIDYTSEQSDFIKRRQEGTGQWLLDCAEFQEWRDTDKRTLFCPGIPGAGKTILTAIVVDDLATRFANDPSVGIAYIYCNFRRQDNQKTTDLLESLLKQLTQGLSSLPDSLKSLYNTYKQRRTRPSLDEISTVLLSVVTSYSKVFVLVDAIDECNVSGGCRSKFLQEVFDLQVKTTTKLFATSRPILDIERAFKGCLSREIYASDGDIQSYLDGHMWQLPTFISSKPQLQEDIKTEISRAVDGMFLLAQLYLDSLKGKTTVKAMKTALQRFGKQAQGPCDNKDLLSKAYDDAMIRINSQKTDRQQLALEVFSWITCAIRPLTTSELQHALAVETNAAAFDEENIPDIETIMSVCAGLVTVDEESNIVRLVHYTTQEYLKRTQNAWFPDAEAKIATICTTYLNFDQFETGSCQTDNEFDERLRLYQFYNYAARNWGHHARKASNLSQMVMDFLASQTKVEASSQGLFAVTLFSYATSIMPSRRMTGLHLAAHFGVTEAIFALIKLGADVNIKDKYGYTPLLVAAQSGHEATVQLLLATDKVDIDLKDRYGRTPLSVAAERGHDAIVQRLLATGKVNSDLKDKNGRTPLFFAARGGHEATVQLLLAIDKVDIDSMNDDRRTPLSIAAERGHDTIIQLLLATNKVYIDSKDIYVRTPLYFAVRRGHETTVQLLLEYGAKVNTPGATTTQRIALEEAVENGRIDIAQLLLNAGAEIHGDGQVQYTRALSFARRNGQDALADLLEEFHGRNEEHDYYIVNVSS